MSYLLDTCILSKARKKNPTDQKLKAWLNKHPDSSYFISVLTLGEIEAGISKIDVKTKEQEKHKVALQEWLRSELIPRFEGRILPISTEVVLAWGKIHGAALLKGKPLPLADGMIAATALHHGLIVVTENTKDFESAKIDLLNPWKV